VSRAGGRSGDDFPVTLDLETLFNYKIQKYQEAEQFGTRIMYECARDSFLAYTPSVQMDQIDLFWLEGYEKWCAKPRLGKNNISRPVGINSMGMYLRCLRHVFNELIDLRRRILPIDKYPFQRKPGDGGYVIRKQEKIKDVIGDAQRMKLVGSNVLKDNMARSLKYWLFMYYCHGMNAMDMGFLRSENIKEDRIIYIRRKTKRTVREIKELIVPITPEIRAILNELGTYKPYIFGIIDASMSEEEKYYKIKQWTSVVNDHVSQIAKAAGIPFNVTTYGARHAVGRKLIKEKVHLQVIQALFGHTQPSTTQSYTKGMNIDELIDVTELLKK